MVPHPRTRFRLDARSVRLVATAVRIALGILVAVAAYMWFEDHARWSIVWRTKLVFFSAVEIGYMLVSGALLFLTPPLVLLFFCARARGQGRAGLGRASLLCTSLILGLVMTETTAAVWLRRAHESTTVPAGGRRTQDPSEAKITWPTTIDRIELPDRFPDEGGDPTADVVVMGESSAAGVPYDWWLSIGSIVTWQLEESLPGRRFRPEILAQSGDTLEGQHRRLATLTRKPDVLIVYAGHNEFSARFPWLREVNHYVDGEPPALWDLVLQRAEALSPFCRLIGEQADICRIALPPPETGYRSLIDEPAYRPFEFELLVRDFERRLDLIVGSAEKVGALPILIVPPSNDSDFEPNRSSLSSQTIRTEREVFGREFLEARRMEESEPAESRKRYLALLERQPGFAEVHFRLSRLAERSGDWEEAYRRGIEARDRDGLPLRAVTRLQDAYRAVATRHGCMLIDGQDYFHRIGAHGLLDDHLFHDGMHPSLRGQIALAQAVLQALHDSPRFGWPQSVPAPVIDPARCAEHFGLSSYAWQQVCNFGIMFYSKTAGARYDPGERMAKQDAFGKALERIKAGARPESVGLPNIGVPDAVPLVPGTARIPARDERLSDGGRG